MDTPGENPGLFGKPFDWRHYEDAEPTDELVAAYSAEPPFTIEQLEQIQRAAQLRTDFATGTALAENNIADLTAYYQLKPHTVVVDFTETEVEGNLPLRFLHPHHPQEKPLRLRVQPDFRQQLFNQTLIDSAEQLFLDEMEAVTATAQDRPAQQHVDSLDHNPAFVYGTPNLIAETAINGTLERANAEAKSIDNFGSTLYIGAIALTESRMVECFLIAQTSTTRLCAADGRIAHHSEPVNLYTLTAYPTLEAAKDALSSVNTTGLAEFKALMGIDVPYEPPKTSRVRNFLKRFGGLFLPPPETT